MSYVLGLDLGTSSLKGLLFRQDGVLVGEASADYPLLTPQAGYSEQNPVEWKEAAHKVIQTLVSAHAEMKTELVGISFSGQMHSLVLLDEQNEVIRPAILWNDVRTTKQCREIMEVAGEKVLKLTKNVALEGFTLPKILWVQENEPENWAAVRHLMLPKDYLSFWLTGKYSMDYSDAAGTLLLDMEEKVWSQDILTQFSISEKILPTLYESSGEVGAITAALKEEFGFENDVKIYAGGADNACAALGSGIVQEGAGMVSIGTSGVFLSFENSDKVDYEGQLHLFSHSVKDKVYSMGVTLAAGNSLSWYRETFAPEKDFSELLAGVGEVRPGADGLLFTPYIVGERTPHTDSQIRGSFVGIDTHHRLPHFSRAVLEGITFSLKDSQEIMEQTAKRTFTKIVSVGGGAKNPDWLQMQADIFDSTIVTLTTEQGPGMGAAMLAAIGSGLFADAQSCVETFVSYDKEITPIKENVELYKKVYGIYKQVYGATADVCHQLAELR
ncbi:xylulokinase [Enterococcus sp. JM4C]|uniref:xylulokinase n=1 Tax=Candidatus Enterococcus huntleyi TaxID=1857217 RepID=UPI00137B55F0|nr:xylulokinase [Enterococcus sp. JM4C]KAF1297356.1 xylulokinase [Enterococcus sp. JM4C]